MEYLYEYIHTTDTIMDYLLLAHLLLFPFSLGDMICIHAKWKHFSDMQKNYQAKLYISVN